MDKATREKVYELYNQRQELGKQMSELMFKAMAMDVDDYELTSVNGERTSLSEVFGDHTRMVLIHNMGKHCNYCTMWADGLNGLFKYIEDGFDGPAARFILVNNDTPEVLKEFAQGRGWNFDCFSCKGTTLFQDLGFGEEKDGKMYWGPGFSTLVKGEDGKIRRHTADSFGPGDSYCGVWHFYDNFPKEEAAGK